MGKGFEAIDYAAVIAYLLGIAAIGSSFYRRRSTARDYFLGGRVMSWLPVGISIIAADLSAISVMGVPAWGYTHNLELAWLSIGYILMAPIVILVFLPFYTKLNLFTAYEYLEKRFDLNVRLVTSVLFQFLRGTHVAIAIYAPSLVINFVTGLPVWECIIFMGLFTTFYTALGGMKAVIWTDVIQFCMVTLGIGLVFYTAITHAHGGVRVLYETALEAGRLKFLNFSTDPKDLTSFWAIIIGGAIIALAPMTTDQVILQRLFTTKSYEESRRSIILQAIVVVPVTLLLQLTGTAIFVFYRSHPARLAGLTSEDAVMPFFAVHELPHGVSGLIIAAIFAASMAVMSAGINALTTATTVDIYQRLFRPHETPQHYAVVGRIGTVAWGLVATFLALFAKYLGELVNSYNRIASFISGIVLGIFLLAVLSKRATGTGSLIGAVAGFCVVSWVEFRTQWSFFYQGAIGLVVTFVMGYVASLAMQPPPPERIKGLVMGCEIGEADVDPQNVS
jgi:SSS family transporter